MAGRLGHGAPRRLPGGSISRDPGTPAQSGPRRDRARLGRGDRIGRAARRCPTTSTGPRIEVEHPAEAEHGDLATNLAMKLARPYRRPPLEIATRPRGEARPRRRRPRATRPRSRRPRSRRPASSTCGSRTAPSRPPSTAILAEPATVGSRRAGPAARGERRVRLGQPDRSADDRQRARRVHRRPAVPGPRGRRPARDARVLLQRLRRPDRRTSARRSSAHPARRAGPRGRLPRRLRRRPRGRRPRRRLGGGDRATAPTPAAVVGHWAAGRVRAGIEASLERLGVHFDVWTSEASLHDEGWVERAVERLRERGHLYEQDGATVVPLDRRSATTRTG